MAEETDFERLGGEAVLRPLIDEFVERVFADAMIGFMFKAVNKSRIQRFEYQHAAEHLGGNVRYEGRPLDVAHRRHKIMGGQFMRRREILRQVLEARGVPTDITDRWLSRVDSLRDVITRDQGSECSGR